MIMDFAEPIVWATSLIFLSLLLPTVRMFTIIPLALLPSPSLIFIHYVGKTEREKEREFLGVRFYSPTFSYMSETQLILSFHLPFYEDMMMLMVTQE
jgi:hypothetical protein